MARNKFAPPTGFTELEDEGATKPLAGINVTDDGTTEEAPLEMLPGETEQEFLARKTATPVAAGATPPIDGAPVGFSEVVEEEVVDEPTVDTSASTEPSMSMFDAAGAGARSGMLRGWDDEIRGFGGGVGSAVMGRGFQSGYDEESQRAREFKDRAWAERPFSFSAGFVPGMLVGPGGGTQGGNWLNNTGKLAMRGGAEGALSGSGNSAEGERIRGGAIGAAGGIIAAPIVSMVSPVVASGSRRIAELSGLRASGNNSMNSGLDALITRAPNAGNEIAENAAAWRASGVEPRLLDILPKSGQRVVRGAAGRSGEAEDAVSDNIDAVYIDMQDRVAGQARRVMGAEPRTARQIAIEVEDLNTLRNSPKFTAAQNDPVALTPAISDVLSRPEGRAALQGAKRLMTVEEGESIDKFVRLSRERAKLLEQVPKDLPAPIQAKIREQLLQGTEAPVLTVDIVHKAAQSLKGRAVGGKTPGLARVGIDMANTLLDEARTASKGFADAMSDFSTLATVGDAATGTGRKFGNSDFLKAPTDTFRDTVSTAERTTPFASENIPSELGAMTTRARDEVVDFATKGTANAMSVAKQLSVGSAQGERNLALLGPRRAGQLRDGMSSEVKRVNNTRFVDPNTGSQTFGRLADEEGNSVIDLGINAMAGGKWGVARSLGRWLRSANIRGVDAERLTRDALADDPARTDAAIEYLVNKGVKQTRARTIVRSIAVTGLARGVGSALAPSE